MCQNVNERMNDSDTAYEVSKAAGSLGVRARGRRRCARTLDRIAGEDGEVDLDRGGGVGHEG